MRGHPIHIGGADDACSQYHTPFVRENDADVGSPSNGGDNPDAVHLPAPSPGDDDDDVLANSDLLAAWTQRLQTLTVVTTFLASTDGQLFSLSALNTQIGIPVGTITRQLTYSCLSGALILHVCACVLGYIASFALVRHKLIDASDESYTKVEGSQPLGLGVAQPTRRVSRRVVLEAVHPLRGITAFLQRPEMLRFLSISRPPRPYRPPPLALIAHCYHTTLCLTTVGFILALIGILVYVWAGLPAPVGIFSSICLGVGVSAGVWALAM